MLSEEEDFSYRQFDCTIVLVGMMGVGKSSIGRRLAKRLNLQSYDSDRDVEKAAGCTVAGIYEHWGERAFRETERKVISRLLTYPPHVLSTGDGAFIDDVIRGWIQEKAISVWLKSDEKTLLSRLRNSRTRPQLMDEDPEDVLHEMIETRNPIYGQAHLSIQSENETYDEMVESIIGPLLQLVRERRAADAAHNVKAPKKHHAAPHESRSGIAQIHSDRLIVV